jgi:DNA helicase II / ATP-dependent DNA helicase PcrA
MKKACLLLIFLPKALALLERSAALRRLIAARHPLIIVDEAQDTGTEQWGCIKTLAELVQLVCLVDLDQQIYDFRRDVSPERLKHILEAIAPMEVDLAGQNNRSPNSEIVRFGNDVLANTPRGSAYIGVSQLQFRPDAARRDNAIRSAVGILRRKIEDATGAPPESIGFLTNWGKGVTIIARALQGGDGVAEISHRVVMDEAEVLLATRVIAACLEPAQNTWSALAIGLDLISSLYRARGNTNKAAQLARNAADAREGRTRENARCATGLRAILDALQAEPLSGNPSLDWLRVRRLFDASGVEELKQVSRLVLYLMGFNRGRRIADSLAEVWQRRGNYEGARLLIEAAITEDQIVGSDGDLVGINVMTMHKSKGKEFDGIIILHLGNSISPLAPNGEAAPHTRSRRLLRVGITRARHHVLMLIDVFSPSPALQGHQLNRVAAN